MKKRKAARKKERRAKVRSVSVPVADLTNAYNALKRWYRKATK